MKGSHYKSYYDNIALDGQQPTKIILSNHVDYEALFGKLLLAIFAYLCNIIMLIWVFYLR